MSEKKFTPRFKGQIALEAIRGKNRSKLAEKYDITTSQIERWEQKIRMQVQNLFTDPSPLPGYSLLKSTLEASADGVILLDQNQKVICHNQLFLKMWQMPEEYLTEGNEQHLRDHLLQKTADPQPLREKIQQLDINCDIQINEYVELKDGRVFSWHSAPQQYRQVSGRLHSFSDVTQYLRTKEKAQRFGKLLRSINANVEEAIMRSTPEQGLVYVNDAFVEMFGYDSKEEVLNTDPYTFYVDRANRDMLLEKLREEGHIKNAEFLFQRKDKTRFYGLETSTLVISNGREYIDGVINDITERKKVEEQLRQNEEKYRTLVENVEDGYFESDLAGNLTFFNKSLQQMVGYPAKKLTGMNNREFMDEEEAKRIYKIFNRVYKTGESEQCSDWKIRDVHGENRYLEASVTLKEDSDGAPAGFRGVIRDITERKKNERKIKESLREKEVLLGEIHHRVKNNLAVISGLLFLQADKTNDKKARQLLKQSESRIHSMALIHEMLYNNQTFSSIDPDTYIRQLIHFISENLRAEKPVSTKVETGKIELDMNTAIPCALIINELLTNAYKYAFNECESGEITVKFLREENHYRLEVSDNGVGIPKEVDLQNPQEEGLGLFLVKTLVKQMNGKLEIFNRNGTTFRILFAPEEEDC